MPRTRRAKGASITTCLGLILITVGGCGYHAAPPTVPGPAPADVADAALADYYVSKKTGVALDQVPAAMRANLIEELRRLRAAAAQGEKQATADVTSEVALARLDILARAAANAAGVFEPASSAELRAAYERYLASLPPSEFHAQHILVATEALAQAAVTELEAGLKFTDVATARSADTTRSSGGDLGWIKPGHLPDQIFTSLGALRDGEYTKQPVHSVYGWHVIKRVATRPGVAPSFERLQAQLAVNVQAERYAAFLAEAGAQGTPAL